MGTRHCKGSVGGPAPERPATRSAGRFERPPERCARGSVQAGACLRVPVRQALAGWTSAASSVPQAP